jgi:CRISPR/Cas system-associated endonuclease Cas1
MTADLLAALEATGLDPAVGFLHSDRPGRPSLALDLVEEFRPFFADRLALSLVNRRQLSAGSFRRLENGATLLSDDGRKLVITAYQERKRDEILAGQTTIRVRQWKLVPQGEDTSRAGVPPCAAGRSRLLRSPGGICSTRRLTQTNKPPRNPGQFTGANLS